MFYNSMQPNKSCPLVPEMSRKVLYLIFDEKSLYFHGYLILHNGCWYFLCFEQSVQKCFQDSTNEHTLNIHLLA